MKNKKDPLRQTVRDIGMFSVGSVTLGAGALAVAPYGSPYTGGVATMGSMMPSLASLTMMKAQVGMLSGAMDMLPKQKRKRR